MRAWKPVHSSTMWPSTLTPDFGLGRFHVGDLDVAEVGDVAQVEAHRLAHEQVERHLVDRRAVRLHMAEGVHMGADMVEHGDEIGLEGHGVAGHAEIERLRLLVAQMRGDDRALEELVRRHVVFDGDAEIDDALAHAMYLSCERRRAGKAGVAQSNGDRGHERGRAKTAFRFSYSLSLPRLDAPHLRRARLSSSIRRSRR